MMFVVKCMYNNVTFYFTVFSPVITYILKISISGWKDTVTASSSGEVIRTSCVLFVLFL